MSNRTKGNAAELRAQALLESRGYLVDRAVYSGFRGAGGGFMSRSNDRFGVFDLLASRHDSRLRCIQVTCGGAGDVNVRKRAIEEIADRFPSEHVSLEVWRWRPGKPTKRSPLRQTWSAWTWALFGLTRDRWEWLPIEVNDAGQE